MDSSRFDNLTRRTFGLVAASAALAGLFGLAESDDAAARRRRRRKKDRCRQLGQSCNDGNHSCCNSVQSCDFVANVTGRVCCQPFDGFCDSDLDCCGGLRCNLGQGRCKGTG